MKDRHKTLNNILKTKKDASFHNLTHGNSRLSKNRVN